MKTIVTIILITLLNASPDKEYVVYQGEKYYKFPTETVSDIDTLFYPGGFTIVQTRQTLTQYDHFTKPLSNENKRKKTQ